MPPYDKDRERGYWNIVLQKVVFPLFTFMVGFTGSQVIVLQHIKETQIMQSAHLGQVDRDLVHEQDQRSAECLELRKHIDFDRQQTEDRMRNVVVLMESIMKQNTEVIGLFKIQQQMQK